jgi:hypothetical protein
MPLQLVVAACPRIRLTALSAFLGGQPLTLCNSKKHVRILRNALIVLVLLPTLPV